MTFRERLHPNLLGILAVSLVGPAVLIVLLPIEQDAAVLFAVLAMVGMILLVWFSTPVVLVKENELRAGRLRIPLSALGKSEVFIGEERRRSLGVRLDARAQLCTSPWVDAVVRVEVIDQVDPTPYLLISSRRPDDLVEALRIS
jgi:hypothetical protein